MGCVTALRDYDDWHRHYDDPDSSLSWRLRRVQAAPARGARPLTRSVPDPQRLRRGRPGRDRGAARPVRCRPGVGGTGRAAPGHRRSGPGSRGGRRPDRRRGPDRRRRPERRVRGRRPGADRAAGRHLRQHHRRGPVAAAGLRSAAVRAGRHAAVVPRARRVGPQRPRSGPGWRTRGFTELDYATSGGEDAAALGVVRYDGPPVALAAGTAAVHVPCAEGGQEPVPEGVHRPDRRRRRRAPCRGVQPQSATRSSTAGSPAIDRHRHVAAGARLGEQRRALVVAEQRPPRCPRRRRSPARLTTLPTEYSSERRYAVRTAVVPLAQIASRRLAGASSTRRPRRRRPGPSR